MSELHECEIELAEAKRVIERLTAEREAALERLGSDDWHIGGVWGDYGEVVVAAGDIAEALGVEMQSVEHGSDFAANVARAIEAAQAAEAALAAANERVTELSEDKRELDAQVHSLDEQLMEEREKVADYENRITWDTTCGNCARLLDASYKDHCRAELAEAAFDNASEKLKQLDAENERMGKAMEKLGNMVQPSDEALRAENEMLKKRIEAALNCLNLDTRSSLKVVAAREVLLGNEDE